MTVIASWVNKEQDNHYSIWTIGDTKVTDANNSILTLENSKVFELTVKIFDLSTVCPRKLNYMHTIGYAYAGSSLVGLNTFSTLSTIFGNLGGNCIPNLEHLAQTSLKVLNYYAQSLCSVKNPFEAIIYGFCTNKNKLERYHIFKNINTLEFEIKLYDDNDDFVLLGDKKCEIEELIKTDRNNVSNKNSTVYWRSPLKTISKITISSKFETIGGGTQLNIADRFGCNPFQAVGERSRSNIKFRNIDIHYDIGLQVGNCLIAINGMDYQTE